MYRRMGWLCLLTVAGGAVAATQLHDADTTADGHINLGELLRVVQFYNAGTMHCDARTEDGFDLGPGDQTCPPHDSDFGPPDWRIQLSELLRTIQFYNMGGYFACPDSEDQYCAGSETPVEGEQPQEFPLSSAGQALAKIVVAADASAPEHEAASELADYLLKITGARFEITAQGAGAATRQVLVGHSATARRELGDDLVDSLGPEEFVVKAVGDKLFLVGGQPRGTLYAVYSFLEDDLGVRWTTWYGDESVSPQSDLAVRVEERRERPAMEVRDIFSLHYSDPETKKAFLIRNRTQGPVLALFGDLATYGGTSHHNGTAPLGGTVHTLFEWVPPARFFAVHPEWYSLVGGSRVDNRQLCFSNLGLRATLTEAVLERIGTTDVTGMFSISAMDVPGGFCECEHCMSLVEREGTPGAPLFDYLAELGPVLAAKYPHATISTLAYRRNQSEIPPKSLVLPDNVTVLVAPIESDFSTPLEHARNALTLENLEAWSRATRSLWIWYYSNPYNTALPINNFRKIGSDFRTFKRLGVKGLFIEHDAPGIPDSQRTADLQTWLLAKLMWNPARDVDTLVSDFLLHHYGSAAPAILSYVKSLGAAIESQSTTMDWAADTAQYRYLTPSRLVEWQRSFDMAVKEADDYGTPVASRVRQARLSLDLACLVKWNELAEFPDVPFTEKDLIERYRASYTEAVIARQSPPAVAGLLAGLDSLLWPYENRRPRTPLQPPLDTIPEEYVRQLTPELASAGGGGTMVMDPWAASGIAIAAHVSSAPDLELGFYDRATTRTIQAFARNEDPTEMLSYKLYPIGRTALGNDVLVWFDYSWAVQFPGVAGFFDPENPDRQWDIFASLRFAGSAYDPDDSSESRYYLDRIVLVQVH